jgi:DNA-binding CsgD family transcriptional regulator
MAVGPPPGRVGLSGRRAERAVMDGLLEGAREKRSGVLVVRGEAGIGKTALLDYAIASAPDLSALRAVGVESEMELAYASLHQLLVPMLDGLERLLRPQRDALAVAFGLREGPAPDRFQVGLAVLSLLSEAADERPVLCVIDDAQWLDRASARALAFVARRLLAEGVVMLFAAREPGEEFAGLPELVVEGLGDADARELLRAAAGRLDDRVEGQLVEETRGNPLALLELPRGLSAAQLAAGFGLLGATSLSGRIEESYRDQLETLPVDTQRMLVVAAAEPTGDPTVLWRAGERLGITASALEPAESAGLLEVGARVRFRHPLVRSAVYGAASMRVRRSMHQALAEATDARTDPDRRAWHLAEASAGPHEGVAAELERAAARAQARGGLAAAAAFLERAVALSSEPSRRAERALAAARAKFQAGALDDALALLETAESGAAGDGLLHAHAQLLRAQIALAQRRGSDAGSLFLSAASRLERLDPELARETYLAALGGAMMSDLEVVGGAPAAAAAARAGPPAAKPQRTVDVLLDAFAIRLTDGYAAAAPVFARALERLLATDAPDEDVGRWLSFSRLRDGITVALEMWDADAGHVLAARQMEAARAAGALVHLYFALSLLAGSHILAGELAAASLLTDEARLIADASGTPPHVTTPIILAAWRGDEARASELISANSEEASRRGWTSMNYARAVLYNGLGRHDVALTAASEAWERDPIGQGTMLVSELAEAASRTGDRALLESTMDWLSERTGAISSEWANGIAARVRAMLSDGEVADALYRQSIERLSGTRLRPQLARAHLLYGEWLRRERRSLDAREQLRTALEMFAWMGTEAFAARAERELSATGEHVHKRSVDARDELSPQEAQVARLARDGLSNREIAARLFISPHTVHYHLRKVFAKLNITSRNQLGRVLGDGLGGE